jgi:cytochrome c-type biogenesis protein CcmH/NrfG
MDKALERMGIVAGIISLLFTVYAFFSDSPAPLLRVETQACSGFLINDPPANLLEKTIPKKKERQYLQEKILCYRDRIQQNPSDAGAYANLGEAHRRLGKLESARKDYQKATDLQPDLPAIQIGLALLEQDSGNQALANGIIDELVEKAPSATAHFYRGAILYARDETSGAKAAWQKAKSLAEARSIPKISAYTIGK